MCKKKKSTRENDGTPLLLINPQVDASTGRTFTSQDCNQDVSLTIAAPVVTQAVITSEQVQRRVQVRVNLVYAIADSFQRHPPVWSLRFMFVRGQTPRKVEREGENANKTVEVHSPLRVPAGSRCLAAHLSLAPPSYSSKCSLIVMTGAKTAFHLRREATAETEPTERVNFHPSVVAFGGDHFRVLSRD